MCGQGQVTNNGVRHVSQRRELGKDAPPRHDPAHVSFSSAQHEAPARVVGTGASCPMTVGLRVSRSASSGPADRPWCSGRPRSGRPPATVATTMNGISGDADCCLEVLAAYTVLFGCPTARLEDPPKKARTAGPVGARHGDGQGTGPVPVDGVRRLNGWSRTTRTRLATTAMRGRPAGRCCGSPTRTWVSTGRPRLGRDQGPARPGTKDRIRLPG